MSSQLLTLVKNLFKIIAYDIVKVFNPPFYFNKKKKTPQSSEVFFYFSTILKLNSKPNISQALPLGE